MIKAIWTEEQITFALQDMLDRINNSDSNLIISKSPHSPTEFTLKVGNKIYLNLRDGWTFLILNAASQDPVSGNFDMNILPWKQRSFKKVRRKLISTLMNLQKIQAQNTLAKIESEAEKRARESFEQAYPGLADKQFENIVLGVSDGKENY